MNLKPLQALLAATCALGPCAAQAPSRPLAWGGQISLAEAQGDLREVLDHATGWEVRATLEVGLAGTLSLRPSLAAQGFRTSLSDYSYTSSRYVDKGSEHTRISAWAVGTDLVYRPRGQADPLYLFAGAFLKAWKVRSEGSLSTSDRLNGTRTYTVDDTSTSNEPAASGGLGWRLGRHLALESRVEFSSYRKRAFNTWLIGVAASF